VTSRVVSNTPKARFNGLVNAAEPIS